MDEEELLGAMDMIHQAGGAPDGVYVPNREAVLAMIQYANSVDEAAADEIFRDLVEAGRIESDGGGYWLRKGVAR